MSDYYTDIVTDNRLKILESRIHSAYKQASEDMRKTAEDFYDKFHDERFAKEYTAYLNGAYTKAEFMAWYKAQIDKTEGYYKMADKLAQRATEADKIAVAYINDSTPYIYSINRNYEAYKINQAYKDIDLHLIDESTVKELMRESNHISFKTVSHNPKRDYEWNNKQIQRALNNAILQGQSIDKLSSSFLQVMKRDENSARRNARTAYTSAQNAGRMDTYEEASEMGIEIEKEWIATLDTRTRDSHQQLDGERVPYDEAFSNGLMYPADADGEPAEVYNCRCTMRAIIPKVNESREVDRAFKDMDNHRLYDDNDKPIYAENLTYKGVGGTASYIKELDFASRGKVIR